jgi:hypothetical protein
MKYNSILILILIVLSLSCSNKNKMPTENSVQWCEKSLLTNSHIIYFLKEYFEDSLINKSKSFFLSIRNCQDTLLFVLYPIERNMYSYNIEPMGIMRYKGKDIFILVPFFSLLKNDTSNYVIRHYREVLEKAHNLKYKIWILKIPCDNDNSVIIKDKDSIRNIFGPKIQIVPFKSIVDSTIKKKVTRKK